MSGSYVALRRKEAQERRAEQVRQQKEAGGGYLPDFLK